MRYSYDEGMVDLAKGEIIPYPQLIEELIEIVSEDAEELGCLQEVLRARDMLERGTSAHKQIEAYGQALEQGASEHEALQAVVDFLIAETARID